MQYQRNLLAITIGLIAVVPGIQAQELDGMALEEIIVTAQHKSENLQDVPIAVSAFNSDALIQADVRSIEDLNGSVPGFYATNDVGFGAAPLSIRGIGGANGGGNVFNDEPVAVYVDGVYVGRLSMSTANLVDVDSVQILRGPQGTLYGRNSTAGALLLGNARPTDSFEGYVRMSAAEFGEYRTSAALSGSLIDGLLAGRVAAGYSSRDGFVGNTAPGGEDLGSSRDETLRLSLQYTPLDTLTVDLVTEYAERQSVAATIAAADVMPGVPSSPFKQRSDLEERIEHNQFELNSPNDSESLSKSVTLAVNWVLDGLMLDSISGYRKLTGQGSQDSDGTGFTLFTNAGESLAEQFSQELRLAFDDAQALSWTTGLYYYEERIAAPFRINNFQGLFGSGTSSFFDSSQTLSSAAAFADISYQVTDRLAVTLGGRYSWEEKAFSNELTVTTVANSIPLPVPFGPFPMGSTIPGGIVVSAPPRFQDDETFEDFSPRMVLDYQFSNEVLGYLSISEGFKSGGFNSFGLAPAFDSEEIEAFEIGLKSELLEQSLRLNISAYFSDYKNLQIRRPVPTGGVDIENAGSAEVRGLEVEGQYMATDNLLFTFNVAWMDTEFTELDTFEVPDGIDFLLGAPVPLTPVDASGSELTRAPELQYNLGVEYSFALGASVMASLALNYRFQDEVFFLETNQDQGTFSSQGELEQVDIQMRMLSNDDVWELAIFGQNLTDERVITQVTALGSYPNVAVNEPRKWGVRAAYRF